VRVWFVSNGRGEDRTAALLARHLREALTAAEVLGAPIIGAGEEYTVRDIPLAVRGARPASGGFSTLSPSAFIRDLPALPGYCAWRASVRRLARPDDRSVVVGDVFALLLTRAAVGPAGAFVSLPKSSVHLPHSRLERRLIRGLRGPVFARDQATAEALGREGIGARFVGNPLMDDLESPRAPPADSSAVLLLPGSRREAPANLGILLDVVEHLGPAARGICALVSSINARDVADVAARHGWLLAGQQLLRAGRVVELWRDRFAEAARGSAIAVGMAGTANEQAAGLGRVGVTCAGKGPQASRSRLRAQERLLDGAAVFVDGQPAAVAAEVRRLLKDSEERARREQAGRDRMGPPGASVRIARLLAAEWGGRT
jgi:uncharacterized protein (TIGR03492 family)